MNQIQYIYVVVIFVNIGCLVSGDPVPATLEQTWWKVERTRFRINAITNRKSEDISINSNGLLVVPRSLSSDGKSLKVCKFEVCSDNKTHICLVDPQAQKGKVGWDQLHNITIVKQGNEEYHDFIPWQINGIENSDDLMKLQTIINNETHYVKVEEATDGEQYRLSKNQENSSVFLIK